MPTRTPQRPGGRRPSTDRLNVAVVTGTRAEFGLLRPVIDAVREHPRLRLRLIASGVHFLPPARTIREVEAAYPVAARVRMQTAGKTGRLADAAATARGIAGFARAFGKLGPDWVVVLGDRIEAFAAASAASIAGIAVCHIHGGDRAEGIADEAMRHAITKLSHLHCAATKQSGERIVRMGERREQVFVTGSPAVDGLDRVKPMSDEEWRELGEPAMVVLLHPSGFERAGERQLAQRIAEFATITDRCVLLAPNSDAGSEEIRAVWRAKARQYEHVRFVEHLPRERFLALLARFAAPGDYWKTGGVLIGNSSAGVIEAAALRTPVLNIGPRQAGRERGGNVVDVPIEPFALGTTTGKMQFIARLQDDAQHFFEKRPPAAHPYGDGRAGVRITGLLAKIDPRDPKLLRKRNAY